MKPANRKHYQIINPALIISDKQVWMMEVIKYDAMKL